MNTKVQEEDIEILIEWLDAWFADEYTLKGRIIEFTTKQICSTFLTEVDGTHFSFTKVGPTKVWVKFKLNPIRYNMI